jgi:mannan endo-1,4-beta-mannosidase
VVTYSSEAVRMGIPRTTMALVGVLAVITACSTASGTLAADQPPPSVSDSYLGVYEPSAPGSYQPINSFSVEIDHKLNIVLYYSGWLEKFQTSFAEKAAAHGATVLVQIDPTNISMSALAAGQYDSYIYSYAQQVRAYGHQVIIGFGHEMNGSWYSWAWKHTPPTAWVSAWRHFVNVFRKAGARNVTWIWTITRNAPPTGPIKDWWPGASYVDWIGIDGYYYNKNDTFQSVFGPTIAAVRELTTNPILLSEVGIGQVSGQVAKIPGLFAGIRRDHLLGLVWFDVDQHGSVLAQDWRLEGHDLALAAFRQAAAQVSVPG